MTYRNLFFLLLAAGVVTQSCSSSKHTTAGQAVESHVVYEPGGIYTSMRIPALVITKQNTLLAFCEARIGSASDWAGMHLALRRSTDEGKTWSGITVIDSSREYPAGNPVPIVDDNGTIHLLYQKNYNEGYYTWSADDGRTWATPVNITSVYDQFRNEYSWKVLAPGPGHGIQLKNGRLLAAAWLANSRRLTPHRSHWPSCLVTIYSDDHGKTWQRGAIVADSSAAVANPSESTPVQLADGRVLLSIRTATPVKRRAFSISNNGISGWSPVWFEDELFDPTCMASIISLPALENNGHIPLLFANPDSRNIEKHPRRNLTVKVSYDDGKTWPVQQVLDSGPSGYSDMAVGRQNTVYCLYETNTKNFKGFNYSLVLKKFNAAWITKNKK